MTLWPAPLSPVVDVTEAQRLLTFSALQPPRVPLRPLRVAVRPAARLLMVRAQPPWVLAWALSSRSRVPVTRPLMLAALSAVTILFPSIALLIVMPIVAIPQAPMELDVAMSVSSLVPIALAMSIALSRAAPASMAACMNRQSLVVVPLAPFSMPMRMRVVISITIKKTASPPRCPI